MAWQVFAQLPPIRGMTTQRRDELRAQLLSQGLMSRGGVVLDVMRCEPFVRSAASRAAAPATQPAAAPERQRRRCGWDPILKRFR